MRNFRIIPSLILLLVSTFPWALAQNAPPRLDVFVEGGGSFLNGSSGTELFACPAGSSTPCAGSIGVTSAFSKAVRLFAGGRFRFTRHDAVEASYSFSPNHFSVTQTGESAVSGYTRMDLISCNYVRYLWTKTTVQPFVTGGVGGNGFGGLSSTSSSLPGLFNASNGWHFAWNFGGGADIVLQRHFAVRLELRDYQSGQPAPGAAITTGLGGISHNIVPSAGIAYRFD